MSAASAAAAGRLGRDPPLGRVRRHERDRAAAGGRRQAAITDHARGLVGYGRRGQRDRQPDRDRPHVGGGGRARSWRRAGIEPTLQLTVRDRNRLAITSELLGGWALGARNVLCLPGDPMHIGDHPDAGTVNDLLGGR